jgi:hypothetical protein
MVGRVERAGGCDDSMGEGGLAMRRESLTASVAKLALKVAEGLDGNGPVGGAEDGGASDQRVCSCGDAGASIGGGDAAIDFESEVEAARASEGGGFGNAREHFLNEGLPAEARFDSHDEEQINLIKKGENPMEGGAWLQRETCG